MTIKDLQPAIVWNNFYLLTRQPRPSKHEEKVREFLLKWGKEKGIETFADETGNVIMRAPATPGYENRKGVILQAHMDMVPQKVASSSHDFLTDPIETEIDGEWVKAKGTTLGADDGLGVAFAMSVLEDKSVKHGPIEVLLTYDEEAGMTGAKNLKPGVLKGDLLINVDSEDEDELCIGCAGGLDAVADFKYGTKAVPAGHKAFKVVVKGLQGGHSGVDISLYRANANKIMAYALLPILEKCDGKVAAISGGSLRNAIPFEAEAVVLVPEKKAAAAVRSIRNYFRNTVGVYQESDPSMLLNVEPLKKVPSRHIDTEVMSNVLKAVIACPSGVIRMSRSMEGLTETSINLAIVRAERGHVKVVSLMRSAIDFSKAELAERVRIIFEMAGARIKFVGGYSGWIPKPGTPLISLLDSTHRKMFGRGMNVMATHGGLECALLGAKYPHWEMVSIGPTIKYPHSPDERTHIPSVKNSWEFLKAVLEAIPEAR